MENKKKLQHYAVTDINEIQFSPDGYTDREAEKADAIKALKKHGVTTKILTGDNEKVTKTVCKQVGMKVRNMLLGADIDRMNDDELSGLLWVLL